MRKVYIVNKSAHDFSDAERFGVLIFLSEGRMKRFEANDMHRKFAEVMKDSEELDYIVPCSLNVSNCIASAIFAAKHKRLNLLLFKNGKYLERNLIL